MRTLDTDALRCFVLGIELGSFARAARRLHRSTSAASAQLKKLEQQCGTALVEKNGRHLQTTEAGEVLLAYARRMLQLHDEALQAISGRSLPGRLAFGLQEDFSEVLLPQVLGAFARAHPQVQLKSVVGRHQELLDGVNSAQLDLALGWEGPQAACYSETLAELPLRWFGPADDHLAQALLQRQPLPLVMFEGSCLMRQQATAALDRAGIAWQIAFVGRSLNSLWQAVEAGLGVTVRSPFGAPAGLQVMHNLPPLGSLRVCLNRSQDVPDELQQRLLDLLKERLLQHLA